MDPAVMSISELNCQKTMIECNQLVRRIQVEPCSAGISKFICSHKKPVEGPTVGQSPTDRRARTYLEKVALTKAASIRLGLTRTGRQQRLPRTKTTTKSHAVSSMSWKLRGLCAGDLKSIRDQR